MKIGQNRIFLLGLIGVLFILTGCTSSVPQSEEDMVKLKLQEFVDYLVKLDYSNAQGCLVVGGPTYSQFDSLFNKMKSIIVSGGYSNCFAKGEVYVNNLTISENEAHISHQPVKIFFNCISSSARTIFEGLNITAAQKIDDNWFLW